MRHTSVNGRGKVLSPHVGLMEPYRIGTGYLDRVNPLRCNHQLLILGRRSTKSMVSIDRTIAFRNTLKTVRMLWLYPWPICEKDPFEYFIELRWCPRLRDHVVKTVPAEFGHNR